MSEAPHNDDSSIEPADSRDRSRRLFRWLLVILSLVVVVPTAVIGYRWQRQMAFISRVEARGRQFVETEQTWPDWFRRLIGDERMRGFESVVGVHLDGISDDIMPDLLHYQPTVLFISEGDFADLQHFGFGRLSRLREHGSFPPRKTPEGTKSILFLCPFVIFAAQSVRDCFGRLP